MNSHFKSALSKVKAEDELILKTKAMLDQAKAKKRPVAMVSRRAFVTRKTLAMACSIVIVVGMSIWGYNVYQTPVAYVSLDINPSIELGLNTFNTVIAATSFNADGQKVMADENVVGSGLDQAIDTLVGSASEHGFIAKDGSTVISVTSESDNKIVGEKIQSIAENGARVALNRKKDLAAIYLENIPLQNHFDARGQGISPGKLNLIHKVQKLDSKVTVDQFKDSKVVEIMNAYLTKMKNKRANHPNGNAGNPGTNNPGTVVTPEPGASSVVDGVANATTNPGVTNAGAATTIERAVKVVRINKKIRIKQNKLNHNGGHPGPNVNPTPTPGPIATPIPRPTWRPRPTLEPGTTPPPRSRPIMPPRRIVPRPGMAGNGGQAGSESDQVIR